MSQAISNGEAASRLRGLAIAVDQMLDGGEGIESYTRKKWVDELDTIADGIDPVLALVRPNSDSEQLSPKAREYAIEALSRAVDVLHATARNLERSEWAEDVGAADREAADFLSKFRQGLQR